MGANAWGRTVTTLLEFIEARLTEDERDARAAHEGPWRVADVTDYGSASVNGPDAMQDGGYDPATGHRRQVIRPIVVIPPDVDYGPSVDLPDAAHIVRHDPARVLREVEAKRRTLARHHRDPRGDCVGCGWSGDLDEGRTEADEECPELLDMASVWSDHPDYDHSWSPS